MRSPFKFLDSYGLEDQNIFFGREAETEQLLQMVFQTPLLLLYGMSGTGKTSLVQCGLAGKFAGPDWLPLWIRRRENINDSLQEAIERVWPKGRAMEPSLIDQVRLLYRYYLRPVYLIFDQFEELFILGDEAHEEETVFTENLRALLAVDLPCKVILSIREEFIGQLYRMEQQIPSIYDFRLRVEPMGRARVKEVIGKSFDQFAISLEQPGSNLDMICDQLSAGKSGIQLPFLQIYLDQLYKADFRRTYPEDVKLSHPLKPLTFETEKIKAFGNIDKVLEQFLLEQQQELEQLLHDGQYKQLPPNTVRLVLDAFVTEEGTKRPVAYEQTGDLIRTKTGKVQFFPLIPEEALSKLLQRLIDNRLLRQESDRLELSHDSLAALIDRARSDQERQVYQLQSRIVLAEKDFGKTKEYLGPGVLGQIDELLTDLQPRLEKKHLDFIAHSHDKQKEDLDVERDRLKREKNLIRSNRERRNQVVWIVIATVIVLALVFYSAQTGLEDGRENKEQAMKIEEQLRQIKELNQILKIAERDRDVFKAAWINDSSNNSSIVMTDSLHGLLKDHRDKKVYPIIRINDQLWMAKNLDYDTIGSWPNKKGDEFGRLYFGPVANEVCPDGWNLPSDDQWKELFLAFGGYQDPFDKGRVGKPEIAYNNLADNGFTLLPGDALNDSGGLMDSTSGFYWSSNGNIYYHLGSTKIIERRIIPEKWSMSCRCVKKKDK